MNGGILGKGNTSKTGVFTAEGNFLNQNHIRRPRLGVRFNGSTSKCDISIQSAGWDGNYTIEMISVLKGLKSGTQQIYASTTGVMAIQRGASNDYDLTFGLKVGASVRYTNSTVACSFINVDSITHVAGVYLNSGTKKPAVYANSILGGVGTDAGTGTVDGRVPATLGYHITGGYYLDGILAEVRVWSVARTRVQLAQYALGGVDPHTTGLVAYWPMNEGYGDMVHDITGNENHGTLTNCVWEEW